MSGTATIAEHIPKAKTPSNRRTVLVVDDQPAVNSSIAYYLDVCGYRALRADSGAAALQVFETEQIDGVLLDVQMPRMNGFETCTKLLEAAREKKRTIKVWFMSGITYREIRDDCSKAGGVCLFQKPFDWAQLLEALAKGLAETQSPPGERVATENPT